MPAEGPGEAGMYASFVQWVKDTLGPPARGVFGPIDEFLVSLPPGAWVTISVLFILLGGGSALFFKYEFIYRGAPDRALWRDLRLWAILFVIPFALLYYFFGRTMRGDS